MGLKLTTVIGLGAGIFVSFAIWALASGVIEDTSVVVAAYACVIAYGFIFSLCVRYVIKLVKARRGVPGGKVQ